MEWTQAHEVGTTFFELHVAAHDLHHVSARYKLLDKCLGDGHTAIVETWKPGRLSNSESPNTQTGNLRPRRRALAGAYDEAPVYFLNIRRRDIEEWDVCHLELGGQSVHL